MKIKLILDERYKEMEIHVCNEKENARTKKLMDMIEEAVDEKVKVYDEYDEMTFLSCAQILRIYSMDKKVYVETQDGSRCRVAKRLYQLEEELDARQFIRISNSEIVNINKIKRLDTSFTGTIKMYLTGDVETFVSRRYVAKIKQALLK